MHHLKTGWRPSDAFGREEEICDRVEMKFARELRTTAAEQAARAPETAAAPATVDPGECAHLKATTKTSVLWSNLRNAVRMTKFKRYSEQSDEFLERFSTRRPTDENRDMPAGRHGPNPVKAFSLLLQGSVHPEGSLLFCWLGVVVVAICYNFWTMILREAFPLARNLCEPAWRSLDAAADVVYLCDIAVQFRTGFMKHGIIVKDSKLMLRKYLASKSFWADAASLIPTDIAYLGGAEHPLLRFPRFVKVYRVAAFNHMAESRAAYPNAYRVATLVHALFLISHWFASFYFMLSARGGPPSGGGGGGGAWAYSGAGERGDGRAADFIRQYLLSFYWASITMTTIGDLPGLPETSEQYLFQTTSYMIGVFIFATVVGQIGNIITNYTAPRREFEQQLDSAKLYMQRHGVPRELQTRVQRWYGYAWTRNRLKGSADVNSLTLLPDKLKTELALHVNLDILKKVPIFSDCEPEFLHDLVLKMKCYIFTPGDTIVRKSEVAREMFIVVDGVLEVLSNSGEIIAQLTAGDFFGEIGILNLDRGVNRRTADVRSVGYSELLVLEKDAVITAIQYYPRAKAALLEHARWRLKEMRKKERNHSKMLALRRSVSDQTATLCTTDERLDVNRNAANSLAIPSATISAAGKDASYSLSEELAKLRCTVESCLSLMTILQHDLKTQSRENQ